VFAGEAKILLTVPEAAAALRIGRSTAYDLAHAWLDSGGTQGLPVVIIGGSLRVPIAVIDRLFAIGGFGPAWQTGLDRRRFAHRSATASDAGDPTTASPAPTALPPVESGPVEATSSASTQCADERDPSQSALTETQFAKPPPQRRTLRNSSVQLSLFDPLPD
jgi:hypothetical protein